MANTNAQIGVGTYAGKDARPYVAPAILAANSISGNMISVLQNVRDKTVLRKFTGVEVRDQSCTFEGGLPQTANAALNLGEVILETTPLGVYEQICNKDLRQTWEAQNMSGQYSTPPADMMEFAAQYVAARVAETMERNIWQGNFASDGSTVNYSKFDGICHLIEDANPTFQSVATGAFTANDTAGTGILDLLAKLTSTACPDAIMGDPNTKIFMSRASANLYHRSISGTAQLVYLNEGAVQQYAGYQILTPAGFPDDTLLISRVDNLYFGTDLLTDAVSASILNLAGVTGDDITRVAMQFSGGTQVVDFDSLGFVARNVS